MSEEQLIRGCAPTLAGLKTGNLICCPLSSLEETLEKIRGINTEIRPKGLCLLPLRVMDDRVLLYLFRPLWLQRDLQRKESSRLLKREGYANTKWKDCLRRLKQRLEAEGEFPHEIGLFLGYPPEDVEGFIRNRAANFKCSGCWKVYGDEASARKLFARYRACTSCYARAWKSGKSLSQLAQSVP